LRTLAFHFVERLFHALVDPAVDTLVDLVLRLVDKTAELAEATGRQQQRE